MKSAHEVGDVNSEWSQGEYDDIPPRSDDGGVFQ